MCEQSPQDLKHFFVLAGYAVLEWWLGKTKRVESNSVLQVVMSLGAMVAAKLTRGKPNGNQTKTD